MSGVPSGTSRTGSRRPQTGTRRIRPLYGLLAGVLFVAGVVFVSRPLLRAEPARLPPTKATAVDETEPLADVRIEGNVTIPASAIARYVKTRPGRPATQKQIREDVRALYGTRWFFSVEPRLRRTKEGLVLVIRVLERPVVRKVEFRGNDKVKTKYLKAETGLQQGSAFDVSANRESVRRIREFYKQKGFFFAKVDLVKGGDPDDREVIFQIEEGPKVRVRWIRFTGNEFVSDGVLRTKMTSKIAILSLIGGFYDPQTIPADIAALKQYYHSLGFFDVVVDHEVHFNDKRSRVTLEYVIEEGQRYKVRSIEFTGNDIFRDDELAENLELVSGEYFNEREMQEDVQGIRGRYGELGRIFASVDAVPRFLSTPGEADLVYRIDEDRPYRINRVNVHINGPHPHTKRQVALNRVAQAGIAPGDLADPALIERAKQKLSGTRVFDRQPGKEPRIDIARVPNDEILPVENVIRGQSDEVVFADGEADPQAPPFGEIQQVQARGTDRFLPADPRYDGSPQGDPFGEALRGPPGAVPAVPPGLVDLNLYLNEAQTGRLMIGAGVNSDSGVIGSIVLEEHNFDILRPPTSWADIANGTAWRGGGQTFRVEAVPGDIVSRYSVSWSDPFIFYSDYSVGASGFFYNRFFDDWDEERFGGRLSVGRLLTPELSASLAYRLENVELTNPTRPTPPVLARSLNNTLLQTIRGSLAHDTRDSPFLPSEGHFAEVSYEQGFGDFVYPRFGAEARQFFTVYQRPDGGGRHVISLGGEFGWTGSETPIYERYFAGGFQTFRGFDFRGVGPVEGPVRVGGRFLALGSVEYKLPVTADENFAVVAFSDFGSVEDSVTLENFRATAGAGLRITVPAMGPVPLAFDFAWPVVKQDFDERRVFSFYISVAR